jgi:hypothetical protein
MDLVVKLLLSKLVELLVKKAEEKFTEAKSGANKKAYVLNKIDSVLDVNDDEVIKIKDDAISFVSDKIENKVQELFNK